MEASRDFAATAAGLVDGRDDLVKLLHRGVMVLGILETHNNLALSASSFSPFLPPPTMPRPTIRGSANWRHLYPTFFRLCHLLQNMALCTSPLESKLYVQDVPGSNPASNWAISFHECLLRSCCSYCEAVLGEISWDCRPDPDRKSGF